MAGLNESLGSLFNIEKLPYYRPGVQARYEGSIDKTGGNADYDWSLYEKNGEWVLLDVKGPGCILNFVQHRYPSSETPVFRFYFDGESAPRFTIDHRSFGEEYPFIEPLASRYIGPEDFGRGPIRVVRSFVPMPFLRGCRITSSVKLEGFDRSLGQGGWGHVIYHLYDCDKGCGTFSEEWDYSFPAELLKQGEAPSHPDAVRTKHLGVSLGPGQSYRVLNCTGAGSVAAVRMMLQKYSPKILENLWIRAVWDDHACPDVLCPAGAFFGNELGYHSTRYFMLGLTVQGEFYQKFPMPFWKSARIFVENRGEESIGIDVVLADVVPQSSVAYEQEKCGYFRTSRYCSRKHIEGADHIIGTIKGKGHLVCSVITGYGSYDGEITCEGDVRIHMDGIGTPQIESDGSESHACYGWGFATPPETNPFSGYDGRPNSPWCQVRTFLTDPIPFLTELQFGIESGGNNDQYMEHSGVLMYYGTEMPGMVLTDEIDIGDENSRRSHRYVSEGNIGAVRLASYYEGDEDHVEIRDETILFTARSSFQVRIIPENTGIRLRRRSDQLKKRQEARVWVDGVPVEERTWYFADGNPYKRWLEDEFEIPEKYTRGKETLSVSIEPLVQENGDTVWNEYHYWVFSKT